jgi:putative oxidoreductase
MKLLATTLTYFFGATFLIMGSNYWFQFIAIPYTKPEALTFLFTMRDAHYMDIVKAIQVGVALMLLVNYKRPLGWLLILPITVNIVLFEQLIAQQPVLIGEVLLAINGFMLWYNRQHYAGFLKNE